MLWFTADTHFNHNAILNFSNRIHFLSDDMLKEREKDIKRWRPSIKATEEGDNHLIEQINKYVKPKDTLWHLGDFCFPSNLKLGTHYRNRIKCKNIHFIFGNHDKEIISELFTSSQHYKELKFEKRRIMISHYAHAVWNHSHRGSWHIYGHSHTTAEDWLDEKMPGRKSIDVGIDNAYRVLGEYRPFAFDDLDAILSPRSGCSIDTGKVNVR